MQIRLRHWALLALIPLCSSCGEQEELIERNDQLEVRIGQLDAEIAEIRTLLRTEVKDVSGEIVLAKEQLNLLRNDAVRMESFLVDLRDEKESLELRFTGYRKTYPIN